MNHYARKRRVESVGADLLIKSKILGLCIIF